MGKSQKDVGVHILLERCPRAAAPDGDFAEPQAAPALVLGVKGFRVLGFRVLGFRGLGSCRAVSCWC